MYRAFGMYYAGIAKMFEPKSTDEDKATDRSGPKEAQLGLAIHREQLHAGDN